MPFTWRMDYLKSLIQRVDPDRLTLGLKNVVRMFLGKGKIMLPFGHLRGEGEIEKLKMETCCDCHKKMINLFATTDGRDKLMKGFSALAKFLGARNNSKDQMVLSASISEGRSILRLAGWINNGVKIQGELSEASPWSCVMALRLLGDAVYCVNDNIAYLTKYLGSDKTVTADAIRRSFVGMFWGFFFAVIIDVNALFVMDRNSKTFREAWRARVLMLTRNVCDLLAALSSVKYLASVDLSPSTMGCLGVISASVSTYENWIKTKA